MKNKSGRIKKQHYSFIALLCATTFFLFSSCVDDKQKTEDEVNNIIAIIGDDTITVDDFLSRSELTLRPQYCDNNKNSDKGIILNSLIAEHLIALEAGKDNPLIQNSIYKAKILGIKEQLMREKLIDEEITKKIVIQKAEIDKAYIDSKKVFQTEVLFIPNIYNPNEIYKLANKGVQFAKIRKNYTEVKYNKNKVIRWDDMDKAIQNVLYNNAVKEGSLLKPIKIGDGYNLIKVITWTQNVEMSGGNRIQEREKIKMKLEKNVINKRYNEYVKRVMQNVKIDIANEGWEIVYNALLPIYFNETNTNEKYNNIESTEKMRMGNETPFLNVDNNIWTIKDFIKAVRIHPLEIRKKNISKENFGSRLKTAIVSLITDTYLTKIAYKKEFEQTHKINREVKQWERYYNFTYEQNKYLVKKGYQGKLSSDYKNAFTKYLNPWYDSLKSKYDDKIVYNPNALKKVKLTKIPLVLYKSKGPYINAVPAFPLATDIHLTEFKRIATSSIMEKK